MKKKLKAILAGAALGALGGAGQAVHEQKVPDPWTLLIMTGIGVAGSLLVRKPADEATIKDLRQALEDSEPSATKPPPY